MKRYRIPVIAGGLGLMAAVVWTALGHAALPPQYDRWKEFSAIVASSEIPAKLGVRNPADRIERQSDGTYRVHGGNCHVVVTLARRTPTGANGQPMVGPAAVRVASVAQPVCG